MSMFCNLQCVVVVVCGSHIYIYHHHQKLPIHSASCLSGSTVSAPVGGGRIPAQVAMGSTIMCACGVFVLMAEGQTHHCKFLLVTQTQTQGQGAKCNGQDQHLYKPEWDAATACSSNHHPTDQLRISTGTGGVHVTAIIATCKGQGLGGIVCPYTSCNEACIGQSNRARACGGFHRQKLTVVVML